MKPVRREMQITADRTRNRLIFVVIIHAGEIPPAGIAAEFDQPRANHDSKAEPAKKPNHQKRRRCFRKWTSVEQWAEKDRQETRFEQLRFPTVTVPNLTDVND